MDFNSLTPASIIGNVPTPATHAPAQPAPVAPVAFPKGGQLVSTAHHQWAKRPADERFVNLFEMIQALKARQACTREVEKPFSVLRAEAVGTDVRLATDKGSATLTHYSFGQLAALAGLPASGLRASFEAFRETAEAAKWVADGLNLGLGGRDGAAGANLLITKIPGGPDSKPGLEVRSINTERYVRVWDLDLVQKILLPLENFGFTNPPAFDGPGGLYSGDQDMFTLMVPRNVARINMPGVSCDLCRKPFEVNGQLFSPFLMLTNSEVGGASLKFSSGLVQAVCANLNLWGVEGLSEISIRHKGEPWKKLMEQYQGFMNKWVSTDTRQEENQIMAAMKKTLATTAEGAREIVLQKTTISQKTLGEATKLIEQGNMAAGIISQDPTNLWNLMAAITANARLKANQNDQIDQVKQAGRLMALASR